MKATNKIKMSLRRLALAVKTLAVAFALWAFLGSAARVYAQVLVTVDPSQGWIGYMNVFALPDDGGNYQFGQVWATSALQAAFTGTNQLLIQPCTNVWETTDTYWVQGDGATPNEIMDASFYVQNDSLVNTNLVFIGSCLSNTLTANPEPLTGVYYTSTAFIKIFDGSYNLIGSATTNLVAGGAFSLTLSTAGATHVQYGFETIGPDANPATVSSLGNVVVAQAAPSATVTVDPGQTWIGYMNVFALPVNGGGYQFGSAWGTGALTAFFTGTSTLTLIPCTNVWETTDTYWVQANGVTPNEIMDASMYVQNDNLVNTNVVFIGTCQNNSLTAAPEPYTGVYYTSVAFIKAFGASYNLLASVSAAVTTGQAFGLDLNTTGAAHVQYGFETIGPDANPATVANLGNVVLSAGTAPAPVPVPTNNAPTPTRPASSVLAMYDSSGIYPIHPVERWLAAWSSAGEAPYTITTTGRTVLKYANLQYAGVEFYSNDPNVGAGGDNAGGATNYLINASAYDTFHVDLWTPNANQFGIQLVSINPTEGPQVDFLPASGTITNDGWISLDIPLSTFTTINPNLVLSQLQQLLWIDNEAGGGFEGGTFYIDNVYFYNSAPTITASLSGGRIQLSFPTQNGSNYTVQYKNNLTDPAWQTLTTVSGNGSIQTVSDSISLTHRFYQLWVH
jgi:hypothetical protein